MKALERLRLRDNLACMLKPYFQGFYRSNDSKYISEAADAIVRCFEKSLVCTPKTKSKVKETYDKQSPTNG